jgi:hypothetical protein
MQIIATEIKINSFVNKNYIYVSLILHYLPLPRSEGMYGGDGGHDPTN